MKLKQGWAGKCWVEGGVQADRILLCGDIRIKEKIWLELRQFQKEQLICQRVWAGKQMEIFHTRPHKCSKAKSKGVVRKTPHYF